MLITTTETIANKRVIEVFGLVEGSIIQSNHLGKDVSVSFKQLVGGELNSYSDLYEESRKIAISRMSDKAELMGANAVIGFRFTTSSILSGAAEILAYGTAVIVE